MIGWRRCLVITCGRRENPLAAGLRGDQAPLSASGSATFPRIHRLLREDSSPYAAD
jgi:hypothetical protein